MMQFDDIKHRTIIRKRKWNCHGHITIIIIIFLLSSENRTEAREENFEIKIGTGRSFTKKKKDIDTQPRHVEEAGPMLSWEELIRPHGQILAERMIKWKPFFGLLIQIKWVGPLFISKR